MIYIHETLGRVRSADLQREAAEQGLALRVRQAQRARRRAERADRRASHAQQAAALALVRTH